MRKEAQTKDKQNATKHKVNMTCQDEETRY